MDAIATLSTLILIMINIDIYELSIVPFRAIHRFPIAFELTHIVIGMFNLNKKKKKVISDMINLFWCFLLQAHWAAIVWL